jgi:hypothetical protein
MGESEIFNSRVLYSYVLKNCSFCNSAISVCLSMFKAMTSLCLENRRDRLKMRLGNNSFVESMLTNQRLFRKCTDQSGTVLGMHAPMRNSFRKY